MQLVVFRRKCEPWFFSHWFMLEWTPQRCGRFGQAFTWPLALQGKAWARLHCFDDVSDVYGVEDSKCQEWWGLETNLQGLKASNWVAASDSLLVRFTPSVFLVVNQYSQCIGSTAFQSFFLSSRSHERKKLHGSHGEITMGSPIRWGVEILLAVFGGSGSADNRQASKVHVRSHRRWAYTAPG